MKPFFLACIWSCSLLLLQGCSSREGLALTSIHIVDRNDMTQTLSGRGRLKNYEKIDFETPQPFKRVARQFKNRDGERMGILTSYYPSGQIMQSLETKMGSAFGSYKEWFEDGTLHLEAEVIGGAAELTPQAQRTWIFDGESLSWNRRGDLEARISYNKGGKEGTSYWYYPCGLLKQEASYTLDRLDGELLQWSETQVLIAHENYRSGQQHGIQEHYWDKETLQTREIYSDGLLEEAHYWDRDGVLLSTGVQHGVGERLVFNEEGLLIQEIRGGVISGRVFELDPSGYLLSVHSMREGHKEGEEIIYYPKEKIFDRSEESSALSAVDHQGLDRLPLNNSRPEEALQSSERFQGELIDDSMTKAHLSLKGALKSAQKQQPCLKIHWVMGQIKGVCQTYYPSGALESHREISDGKIHGVYRAHYPSGDLRILESYRKGILQNGKYWALGDTREVSRVIDGQGTATLFDHDGELIEEIAYIDGVPSELDMRVSEMEFPEKP